MHRGKIEARFVVKRSCFSVIHRNQQFEVGPVLSITIKRKVEISQKFATGNQVAKFRLRCKELRIGGYVIWSTHLLYSKQAKEWIFMRNMSEESIDRQSEECEEWEAGRAELRQQELKHF